MATAMQRRLPYNAKSRSGYSPTEMPPIDRKSPVRVPTYAFPDDLRPIAQLGYEGARHLVPERLPSSARRRTVGFRVIDLNRSVAVSIRSAAASLRRLDLSDLNLEFVDPELIDGLLRLERIVLDHNRLGADGFPDSVANLDRLVELSAHDNLLAELPVVIRKLRGLRRLKLSDNRIRKLDGIERLTRLQILVLDDNELDLLPAEVFARLKRLEYLHCARNRLTVVPSDVRHLRMLRHLDVSGNELTSLPADLFLLPHIDVINASGNRIDRLPTTTTKMATKGNRKRKLAVVDLSENRLCRFPSDLMLLTSRLDLSGNNIRTLPISLVDRLDQLADLRLLLADNPMTLPPRDVCEGGLRSIVQYFVGIRSSMRMRQGVRVLVLGASGQGKTSLIQSLTDGQARLTDGERTVGVDVYEHGIGLDDDADPEDPLGRRLDLSLWDFSGDPRYLYQHEYFLEQNSLVLLVFDMARYRPADFRSRLGVWIDWIVFRTNGIVLLPVGTHADCLTPAEASRIGDDVTSQIGDHVTELRRSVEREIRRIDSKSYISASLSEQLEMYRKLMRMDARVHATVVAVSSKDYRGFGDLERAIVRMVDDRKSFPNVLREIPSLWAEVASFIDDRAYVMAVPILKWDEYVTLVTGKFGLRHLIAAITEYMHDVGKVIWYSSHPTLRNYIFLRPSWISDILKALFRHDIAELDYSLEDCFRQQNIGQARFDRMIGDVVDEAIFDLDLIRCLWSGVIQTDDERPILDLLVILLDHFEIGYATVIRTPPRGPSAASSSAAKPDTIRNIAPSPASRRSSATPPTGRSKSGERTGAEDAGNPPPRISKILIPWLLNPEQPSGFRDEYQAYSGHASVTAVFRFPKYIAPGLFERFAIRCLKPDQGLARLYHWKNGLYARQTQGAVRLYLQRIEHDDGSTCISVECRHESPLVNGGLEKQAEQLWQLLLPVIRDCEDVVAKSAGARMERYMECPYCRGLSFLGEWLTPKELQTVELKTCDNCNRDVSTALLVQPKEKKRVEEFLLKRLLEEAEKRRLAAEEATTNTDDNGNLLTPTTDRGERHEADLHPNALSLASGSSDGRNKASQKGVDKPRHVNGDRVKSGTTGRGTVRLGVHGSEKSAGPRLRTHSSRSNDGLIQEEHILVTLPEQNPE